MGKSSSPNTPWACVIACLLLTGCAAAVEDWQIEQVQKQCEARGGIHEISTFVKVMGQCRDGSWVFLKRPGQ